MTALTDRRIIGIRSGDRVIVPPLEWDPETAEELAHDFVDVGPAGTVDLVVVGGHAHRPAPARPPVRVRPDPARRRRHVVPARGRRRLDRRDEHRHAGRTALARRPHRPHHRHRGVRARRGAGGLRRRRRARRGAGHDDGLQRVDHLHAAGHAERGTRPSRPTKRAGSSACSARCAGAPTPAAGATARSTACALGPEHEVDLPQRGTITNYTIITPVQYPGQTETEPFARVHVLLDDTDVVLGYQALLDTPNDDVRIGMRVSAVWASEAELAGPRLERRGQPPRLDAHRRARRERPRPREQDPVMPQTPTTSRSSAGRSRRWCAAPTRPKRRCSSR